MGNIYDDEPECIVLKRRGSYLNIHFEFPMVLHTYFYNFKNITLILLYFGTLLAYPGLINAQDTLQRLTVTQTTSEARGTVFREHPDKAGVIIESPLTNLRFSSNLDGIVEERHQPDQGRYVLIIEPFTQIIAIDAPGFMQERLRIGSPAPRDVRHYIVEPEERFSDLISVIFNVEPDDATLFVDGQETEMNRAVQLVPGARSILVERDGYRSVEETIEVNTDNILFEYRLDEVDIVPVRIQANVTGAQVSIDGDERGEIDSSGFLGLWLFPGSYVLEIRHSGYLTQTHEIAVKEDGDNRFDFTLDRNVGELVLNVAPSDARISINRQNYSGQRQIELAPGRYRLDIEKDGYEPHSETFDLDRNQRLSRRIDLKPHTGSLRFNVTPGSARVTLQNAQGQQVQNWQGIQHIRSLPVGSYRLSAAASGYEEWSDRITIVKDTEKLVEISLNEMKYGSLKITANVSIADGILYRNGTAIKIWTGRRLFNRMEPGNYKLTFEADNPIYKKYETNFRLLAGENKTININLKTKSYTSTFYINTARFSSISIWNNIYGILAEFLDEKYSFGAGMSFGASNINNLKNLYTFDAKVGISISNNLYPYVQVGLGFSDIDVESSLTFSDEVYSYGIDVYSYGFGISYYYRRIQIGVGYNNYYVDDFDLDMIREVLKYEPSFGSFQFSIGIGLGYKSYY